MKNKPENMYLTEKAQKIVKIIAYSIEVLLLALVVVFGSVATNRGKEIKAQKAQIAVLQHKSDSLEQHCYELGAEAVIQVTTNFNMTQKNVFSFNQTNMQNVAKEVATLTRQELYDSLYAKKANK